jgi:hypothetical protein
MPVNITTASLFLGHEHCGYAEQSADAKQCVLHQAVRQVRAETRKHDADACGGGGSSPS